MYVAGGAGDERTMRENIEAFARWRFLPRVLVDTSARDLSTTILGRRVTMPIGIAPFALQGLLDPEGEVATARAATAAGVFMGLSMGSNRTIEDVADAATCPLWFQPYVTEDHALMRDLAARAEAAGYAALCVTVDSPVSGRRDGAMREPVELPEGVGWANMPADLQRPGRGKWLTDLYVTIPVARNLDLSIGGLNIFDVYPDKWDKVRAFPFPQLGFIYGWETLPFGINGGYYYARLRYHLGH